MLGPSFFFNFKFEIDENIINAIKENCHLIDQVSFERIRDEISKILCSDNPFNMVILKDTGLLKNIMPEFDICFETSQNHPYHLYNVAIHTLHAVRNIENKKHLRWTMLLHDTGKAVTNTTDSKGIDHFYNHGEQSVSIAKKVLERFKFDNKTIHTVLTLIKHHDRVIAPTHKSVRKAVNIVGEDIFTDLLKVQEADRRGQNLKYSNKGIEKLQKIKEIYFDVIKNNHCFKLGDLAVNGNDLIGLGLKKERNRQYFKCFIRHGY